jgi:hypothetical protein
LGVSEYLYTMLLAAYPKEFRNEYRSQMTQAFRDLCRDELERSGMVGLPRFWVRTILDLMATAFEERSSCCANNEEATVNERRVAGIGLVFLLAPLYFVSAALLKYGLGIGIMFDPLEAFLSDPERLKVFNTISPVVFLGGLALALALNACAVLRINVGREDGAVVGILRLDFKLLNVAVVAASSLLLVILVGYVILENFTHR